MRTRLFILFSIALPLYCMELPRIASPEQTYNFLVTNNSAMEKQETALHLNILVSLIYNAAYDHILSLFVRPCPVGVPAEKAARVIKASDIALNAYAHAADPFLKTVKEDNKTKVKKMAFDTLERLLGKEIEILNKRYKPAMRALRDLGPTGECLIYPQSISLEYFLFLTTGCPRFSDAVAQFYGSST